MAINKVNLRSTIARRHAKAVMVTINMLKVASELNERKIYTKKRRFKFYLQEVNNLLCSFGLRDVINTKGLVLGNVSPIEMIPLDTGIFEYDKYAEWRPLVLLEKGDTIKVQIRHYIKEDEYFISANDVEVMIIGKSANGYRGVFVYEGFTRVINDIWITKEHCDVNKIAVLFVAEYKNITGIISMSKLEIYKQIGRELKEPDTLRSLSK